MEHKIFVINPGSTSTKLAYFIGAKSVFENVIRHDPVELKVFNTSAEQFHYRFNTVKEAYDKLVRFLT